MNILSKKIDFHCHAQNLMCRAKKQKCTKATIFYDYNLFDTLFSIQTFKVIPDLPKPGLFAAYDLAITDPTQKKYAQFSAVTPGYASNDYAINVKVANYSSALSHHPDVKFTPIILETFVTTSSKC